MNLEDKPGWYTVATKPVLHLLDEIDEYWMNASTITFNIEFHMEDGPSRSKIYDHLDELVTAGVIEMQEAQRGTKLYRITDKGRAYLAGEIDASELED